MLILDTDHLSILDQDTMEGFNLGRRLSSVPPAEILVTIITYEEQMRGWLAYAARAKTQIQQTESYRKLRGLIEGFCEVNLVDYNTDAADQFVKLRQAKVRVGTPDLKIAAICLVNDATLLTRNLRHFQQVPGLKAEDWSL